MPFTDLSTQLTQHDILPTPQRLEIAAVLLHKEQHLSVEQILEKLRTNGSSVSKATVYNTLNLFGEKGLVKEICVDPERRYFDSATHPHQHHYNIDTGELTDIPASAVQLANQPDLPAGTEPAGVDILIKVRNQPVSGDSTDASDKVLFASSP